MVRGVAHARELRKIKKWIGVNGTMKRIENKDRKNNISEREMRKTKRERERDAVTACDNSCEIVSFIVSVITIIVILRVPTAIS